MEFTDICLITDDVVELTQFYESVFSVRSEGGEVHSVIKIGGLDIAVYARSAAESDMGFNFTGTGTGLFTIGFNVDDVDAEYARIVALGICAVTEPHVWPWGAKSFRFPDIDGNIIVIRSWPDQTDRRAM